MAIHQVVMYGRYLELGVETRATFYTGTRTSDGGGAQEYARQVALAWEARLAAYLSNQWELYQATCRDVSTAGMPEFIVAGLTDFVGGSVSEALPPTVTLPLSFNSYTERPNRARKLLPGFVESANDGGRPLTALRDAAADFANDLNALITTVDFQTTNVTVAWGETPPRVVSAHQLTGYKVATEWGVLKKRKPGVGI